jgi:hypothetical protein
MPNSGAKRLMKIPPVSSGRMTHDEASRCLPTVLRKRPNRHVVLLATTTNVKNEVNLQLLSFLIPTLDAGEWLDTRHGRFNASESWWLVPDPHRTLWRT